MITILYVDDAPELLEIGRIFLEKDTGFSVTTLHSAKSALHILETQPCDAIISDYQMPEMDGITFLIEVRKKFGMIPFILLTGKGREEVVIQALNNGADFYLQKGGDPVAQFTELANKVLYAVSRRRAEESLRKRDLQIRTLFENIPIGMFQSTPEGKFIFVNSQISRMLGYDSPSDVVGMVNQTSIAEALYEEPERRPRFVREVVDGGGSWKTFENQYRTKDGRKIDALLTFSRMNDPVTGENHLYGFVQDITDQKNTEFSLMRAKEKLVRQTTSLTIMSEIISTANQATTRPQLFQEVLDKTSTLLGYDAGGIYLIDPDREFAHLVHNRGLPPDFEHVIQKVPVTGSPYERVFSKGKSLFTDRYDRVSPRHFGLTGFSSIACVPLVTGTTIIGALNLASRDKKSVSPDDQSLLISISRELGSIIARLTAEEDLKTTAIQLATSEARLSAIIRVAPVGIGVAVNRIIHSVNDRFCLLTGYAPSELTGKPSRVLYLTEQDYRAAEMALSEQIKEKGHGSVQGQLLKKDGSRISVIVSSTPIDPSDLSAGIAFTVVPRD